MHACPEGAAQTLIRIHGRLWPCAAGSVDGYNKTGIFRAYNFCSEAKGTRGWCGISANMEQEGAWTQSLPLNSKEQAVRGITVTLHLFSKCPIPLSSANYEYFEHHQSSIKTPTPLHKKKPNLNGASRKLPDQSHPQASRV